MKLYTSGRAPNPRRVRIFLAEKGVTLPMEEVDIGTEVHLRPEFAAINPVHRLPVLELDDGRHLSESVAICRFLESRFPEPNLMGRDAEEGAFIEMWNRRIEHGLLFHVAQVFRHMHPAMRRLEVPQIAEWSEANRPKVADQLRLLNEVLRDRAFIAGDRFTIADITAIVAVDFMKPAKIELPDAHTHIARWRAAVTARPGVIK